MQTTKLITILQNIGFTEKEAQIYLVLLELNESIPSAIARRSGVKRANTYAILNTLQEKGLVNSVKRKKHLYFKAIDPKIFLENEKQKHQEIRESVEDLSQALPELLSLHQQHTATPQMSVYSGKSGLIQIMEDTLTASTELLCWANPSIVFSLLEDYYPKYVAKKVKNKIWLRGIFCADEIAKDFKAKSEEELREVYLIPKERFPFKNEINIYDDKVAIISHKDQVGVIIQNKDIADTQRAIFEFGFEYAKLLEKEASRTKSPKKTDSSHRKSK